VSVSPAARDLVAALLAKDPARRLGATVGAAAIKLHPFFGGVNWDGSCPGTPVEYY